MFLELFYALIDEGVFPKKARVEVEASYLAWVNRKGHYNDYLMRALQVHYSYLGGKSKKLVDAVTRRMIAGHKDRVYRYTRDLIPELKKKGFYIIALSNSQDYVVAQFAKKAGFDASIARRLEVKDGKYTGRVMSGDRIISISDHVDKVAILKDFLERNGIRYDLSKSVAVGDSEGDIAMLNAVGYPITFNPSSGLAKVAKERGWKIFVERKDVVYDISDKCTIMNKSEKQHAKWK